MENFDFSSGHLNKPFIDLDTVKKYQMPGLSKYKQIFNRGMEIFAKLYKICLLSEATSGPKAFYILKM